MTKNDKKSQAKSSFAVRLDDKTANELNEVCSSLGLTKSEAIRLALLGELGKAKITKIYFDANYSQKLLNRMTSLEKRMIEVIERTNAAINSLKAIGNNINQIARGYNKTHVLSPDDLRYIQETILACIKFKKEMMLKWQSLKLKKGQTERKT